MTRLAPAPRRRAAATPRARRWIAFALCAGAWMWLLAPAPARAGEPTPFNPDAPLPSDPAVASGTLPNGVSYVVKRHPRPAGGAIVRLIVSSGALDEEDEQRGAAAIVARLLWNSSAQDPAGAALAALGAAAPVIGDPDGVVSELAATSFTLELPQSSERALDSSLALLRSIASGAAIREETLAAQRAGILTDERARSGAGGRLARAVLPRLAPGSRLADRSPVDPEEALCRLNADRLREFHSKAYGAGSLTLVIVGDVSSRVAVDAVARRFGSLPARPRPLRPDLRLPEDAGARVAVARDEQMNACVAELLWIDGPAPGPRTEGELRARLVEEVGVRAVHRRLRTLVSSADSPLKNGAAWAGDGPGGVRLAMLSATGDPESWPDLIGTLALQCAQARDQPLSESEWSGARADLLAELDESARIEPSTPAREQMERLTLAVRAGSTVLSAPQRAALASRLLAESSADEASARLVELLDLSRATGVVILPPGGVEAPEAEVLARIEHATAPAAPCAAADPGPRSLLSGAIEPGQYTDLSVHPLSGVTSAWLASGVRVHHRAMTSEPGRVALVVTIAGGCIEESAGTRGLTVASLALWKRPASSDRPSEAVARLLNDQRVSIKPIVWLDRVELVIGCARENLESALQLVHILLTGPRVEPGAFDRWKWASLRQFESRRVQPLAVAGYAMIDALYPRDDPRQRLLLGDELRALTCDAAQRWVSALVARAPIEAAIVGDVPRSEALDLAARYLGSLPPRERIGTQSFCERRHVAPPAREPEALITIESPVRAEGVLLALPGADDDDSPTRRALDLAAELVAARLRICCAGASGMVDDLDVRHQPAAAYPGTGLFYASAQCPPGSGRPLAARLEQAVASLASDGPSPPELELARSRLAARVQDELDTPVGFARALSDSTYRARSIDAMLGRRAAIESLTPADVSGALRLANAPGSRFRVIVTTRPPSRPAGDRMPVPTQD